MILLGISFSFIALFGWAFGDFFLQLNSRKVGSFQAILFTALFNAVLLFPVVFRDLPLLFSNQLRTMLLVMVGFTAFFAALFNTEALRGGKLSILEPITGLELPLAVGLSVLFRSERVSELQLIGMVLVFVGILFVVTTKVLGVATRQLEEGVALAGLGMIALALTSFLIGVLSQETGPLLTIWLASVMIGVLCLIPLFYTGKIRSFPRQVRSAFPSLTIQTLTVSLGWLAYAKAVTYIPISIALAISEGYIILGVLLGVYLNKEKVYAHQKIGIGLAVLGILLISLLAR